MSTPSTLFAQLQLAEASYSLFSGPDFVYGNQNILKDRLLAANRDLYGGNFSDAQADEFIKHWKVINYQGNTSSGFAATLFESLDPEHPGQLTLAFRGTDQLLTDISDIVLDGLALDQIVDMFNYVQQLKATQGSRYQVARLETDVERTQWLKDAYGVNPTE
jgi:hypothetical protein